jgi:hypothetical protein
MKNDTNVRGLFQTFLRILGEPVQEKAFPNMSTAPHIYLTT